MMRTLPTSNPLRLAILISAFTIYFHSGVKGEEDDAELAVDEPVVVETKTAFSYYSEGGLMMHFLLLCSMGTIAVTAYCFINVSPRKMVPKGMFNTLLRMMRHRQVGEAYQLCNDQSNSFTSVVSAALLKVNFDRDQANRHSMEQAAAETLDQEETRSMLWVNYLNVFATIAPMLGLLGTVGGMIISFDQLAAGRSDPSDLAGGIGIAMVTTASGLLVGIPAMFFYFFFRNRVMAINATIQKNVTFLIDVLSGEVTLAGDEKGVGEGVGEGVGAGVGAGEGQG